MYKHSIFVFKKLTSNNIFILTFKYACCSVVLWHLEVWCLNIFQAQTVKWYPNEYFVSFYLSAYVFIHTIPMDKWEFAVINIMKPINQHTCCLRIHTGFRKSIRQPNIWECSYNIYCRYVAVLCGVLWTFSGSVECFVCTGNYRNGNCSHNYSTFRHFQVWVLSTKESTNFGCPMHWNNVHYNPNAMRIPDKLSNFSINSKCNLPITYSYMV
jgi:hypothetical protein